MEISEDVAKRVADLARVHLEPDEVAAVSRQLTAILRYVDVLAGVDTDGVEPTCHVEPIDQPLREDAVGETLDRGVALALAPTHDDAFFVVPQVVGGADRSGSAA